MAEAWTAKKVLEEAVECDNRGRIFEAVYHYEEGTHILMSLVAKEDNEVKQKTYYERIKEYIERAEEIKQLVQSQVAKGKLSESVVIPENCECKSYAMVFGDYLDEQVEELVLQEPYLDGKYLLQDLITFLELVVYNCPQISYIRIITCPNVRSAKYQVDALESIKEDMTRHGIVMSYVFDSPVEPKIIMNTGYIIKMKTGLHYFKPPCAKFSLGLCDYNYRKCCEVTVDVYKTEPFSTS